VAGAIKEKLTLGGGEPQQQQPYIRLGGGVERAVKERAAEKAAEVYFEEKDRLARERGEERAVHCVDKCVEGCAGSSCARTAPARCDAVAGVRVVPRPCRPSVHAWRIE
jgi:hypothetical protein